MSIPALASKIIEDIILEEGGWKLTQRVNDPDVATYGGMRYQSLRDYMYSKFGTVDQPEVFIDLAEEHDEHLRSMIRECYYEMYYVKAQVDYVPRYHMRAAYYSCAVNVGVRSAGKILQRALNADWSRLDLTVDGIVGMATLSSFERLPVNTEIEEIFIDEWIRHYVNIVQANSLKLLAGETTVNQAMNLEGWFNRATHYRYE